MEARRVPGNHGLDIDAAAQGNSLPLNGGSLIGMLDPAQHGPFCKPTDEPWSGPSHSSERCRIGVDPSQQDHRNQGQTKLSSAEWRQ